MCDVSWSTSHQGRMHAERKQAKRGLAVKTDQIYFAFEQKEIACASSPIYVC